MKKTLLTLFSLVSLSSLAQTVNSFYTSSVPQTGYTLGAGSVNETTSGANVSWDFSSLTANGTSITQTLSPSADETTTYPNTQLVASSTGEYNGVGTSATLNIYTTGGGTITGLDVDGVVLNYSTNNATLGTFPLQYGYSYTDQVAGTFNGLGYSGTFTGTCVTSVDAYGTITSTIGDVNNTTLTRLKVVQNLNLYYMGFQAGTVTQTIYVYYAAGETAPKVRSIANNINVPALSVNYDFNAIEVYDPAVMSTDNKPVVTLNKILPNPATDVLHFTADMGATKVTIADASGRIVLNGTGNNLNITTLNTGVYFATTETNGKTQVTKFIKK